MRSNKSEEAGLEESEDLTGEKMGRSRTIGGGGVVWHYAPKGGSFYYRRKWARDQRLERDG